MKASGVSAGNRFDNAVPTTGNAVMAVVKGVVGSVAGGREGLPVSTACPRGLLLVARTITGGTSNPAASCRIPWVTVGTCGQGGKGTKYGKPSSKVQNSPRAVFIVPASLPPSPAHAGPAQHSQRAATAPARRENVKDLR